MSHQQENQLPEADVRSIIRLLGEVAAHEGTEAQRKRFLMNEICRLVDCDYWVWVLVAEMEPGKLPDDGQCRLMTTRDASLSVAPLHSCKRITKENYL